MKKRFMALLLAVTMLLSLVVVPVNAAQVEGTGILTITPNVTSAKGSATDPVEVIYTIKVTPPEGKSVGEFHFTLSAPEGMTLSTTELDNYDDSDKGGNGVWVNGNELEYDKKAKTGIFESVSYTTASQYFIAYGTTTERNLTAAADVMTIKATIAANKIGDFTLTATDVGINKDGTDSYAVKVETTPVTVYADITGAQEVNIATPVKGAVPQSTITATDKWTGAIEWEYPLVGGGFGTNPAKFAASTDYTAVVTLTAKEGYRFVTGAKGTCSTGSTTLPGMEQTISEDGTTLTFPIGFPTTAAKSLTALTITHAPTKTTYEVGETFDKTGMVVTATYDDSTTADVTAGVTFAPSTALATSDNKITVSYTENSVTKTADVTISVSKITAEKISSLVTFTEDKTLVYSGADQLDAVKGCVTYKSGETADTVGALTVTVKKVVDNAVTGEALTAVTDAGTYAVFAATAGGSKYESVAAGDAAMGTVTIAPKPISGRATVDVAGSYAYTGEPQTPAAANVTVTLNKGAADAKALTATDYTVAYSNNTDAGTATVTVTGNGNYTGTATGSFTIAPKTITATVAVSGTYTYTGSQIKPLDADVSVTSGGTYNSYALVKGTDYTIEYGTNVDAGTNAGSVTVTAKSGSNYTFTAVTKNFNIAKADLTYTAPGTKNVRLTDTSIKTFNVSDLAVKFDNTTVAGKLVVTAVSDTENILAAKPTVAETQLESFTYALASGKSAGNTADITMKFIPTDSTNYKEITGITLTIKGVNKETATVTVSLDGWTYGGTPKTPVTTVTLVSGTADPSKVTYFFKNNSGGDFVPAIEFEPNAGTYTVKAIYEDADNMGENTASFTVSPKALTAAMIGTISAQTFTGSAIEPAVTVTDGSALTKDTDYTVAYSNNTNVGSATVTVTGKGNYTGTASKTFAINPKTLTDAMIGTISDQAYTGSPVTPAVTVTDGSALTKDTDYTVAYSNNTKAGTATVTVTGKGNYTGTASKTFTITPKALAVTISVDQTCVYDGTAQEPTVTVTDGSATLTKDTDYTVAYSDNTNAGENTATVTITGKGNYAGTASKTFTIHQKILTFTAQVNDKTYNGDGAMTVKADSVQLVGVLSGDTVNVSFATATALVNDTTNLFDAGTYTATVTLDTPALTGTDAANYKLSAPYTYTTDKVAVIEPLDISVSVEVIFNLGSANVTAKKGDDAASEIESFAGGLPAASQTDMGIVATMTNVQKAEAIKKYMAKEENQSVTDSVLYDLTVTTAGTVVLAYPAGTNGNYTFKLTHMKNDGSIEVITLTRMNAGLKFTIATGSPYLLSWTAPVNPGSSGGSSAGYGHTVTTDLTGITSVKVDGKAVNSKYYTISGSNVTFSEAFMKTLTNGKHTVTIENKTHVATAVITVTTGKVSSAKTGDAGVMLYAAMALTSAAGAGAVWVTSRKKDKREEEQ